MSRYGNLEIFQRVHLTSIYRESTVYFREILLSCHENVCYEYSLESHHLMNTFNIPLFYRISKRHSSYASEPGAMINRQKLDLPMFRKTIHGLKDVPAIQLCSSLKRNVHECDYNGGRMLKLDDNGGP